jgi:DNA polymerase III subunit epsilon
VLALRGNPRAAAAAVFALLAAEERVQVDATGTWSLVAPPSPPEQPLSELEWVVVDVETTGGSAGHGHRIIEFSAVHVANGRIQGDYSTLVNPGRAIPRIVCSLTGIAEDMVASAPTFEDIAPRVAEELGGRVFVAHNAGFDWRFVSAELERCMGKSLAGRRLCTLRIARRVYPHLHSRSLGYLAEHLGIPMEAHHRARDDAMATAQLLLMLLDSLEGEGVLDWAGLESYCRRHRRQSARRRTAMPRSMDRA